MILLLQNPKLLRQFGILFYSAILISMQPQKNIFRKAIDFVSAEDGKMQQYLKKRPILYTFIGGTAVILFWRGIWHTADMIPFLTGPVSMIIGGLILLVTGLFAFSFFVGEEVLVSDIHKEEKMVSKTEGEIKKEEKEIHTIEATLEKIEQEVEHLHKEHSGIHEENPPKDMVKD